MGAFAVDWSRYRLVDLSFTVIPGASRDRYFDIERGRLADRATMHHVRTHTHVGTHVEVDAHFFEGGRDVTAYELGAFMGRALLLDVPDAEATCNVGAAYLEAHLGNRLSPGDIVLCRNLDAASRAGQRPVPYLSADAGRWLAERGVKMVGIDTHFGLGRDIEEGRAFHAAFMGAGGTLVEFLDHLEDLQRDECFFMALPFKAQGVDSGWARAVAIEER
jgi:arylformamidase